LIINICKRVRRYSKKKLNKLLKLNICKLKMLGYDKNGRSLN